MVYMQCPHELEIKYLTWMGLEPWHSGLWVQSLASLPEWNSPSLHFGLINSKSKSVTQWIKNSRLNYLTLWIFKCRFNFELSIKAELQNWHL